MKGFSLEPWYPACAGFQALPALSDSDSGSVTLAVERGRPCCPPNHHNPVVGMPGVCGGTGRDGTFLGASSLGKCQYHCQWI